MNELYHHGIKGMKWGVRRYQNKDGSLTRAGKKRLDKVYNRAKKEIDADHGYRSKRLAEVRAESGITDYDSHSVLAKGTEINRISNTNKEKLGRPTYASTSWDDFVRYQESAAEGLLEFDPYETGHTIYGYKLSAIKDIKIANGKEVVDYILENKGASDLAKQYVEIARTYPGLSSVAISKPASLSKRDFAYANSYLNKGREETHKLLRSSFIHDKDFRDKMFDEFKRRGYDAIEDVEDSSYLKDYGSDTPMILLDPSKSVKVKRIYEV